MKVGKVSHLLSRISITQKILLIFLGCVMVPAILQNVFYFTETEQNMRQEIEQKMNNTLDDKIAKLDMSFSDLTTLSIKYNNHDVIYRTLDQTYSSDLEYLVAYQETIQQSIVADLPFHLQVDAIKLYSDNPTLFNGALMQQKTNFVKDDFKEDMRLLGEFPMNLRNQNMKFQVGLEYSLVDKDYQRKIYLFRRLKYYPQYAKYNKAVQLTLNETYFNTMLSDMALFDNLILVDDDQRVLFSANTYRQTGKYDFFDQEALPPHTALLQRKVTGFPLTLYGYYDINMISGDFNRSRAGALAITLLSLIIAGICILVVGNNITQRTRHIVDRSVQIAGGNFGAPGVVDSGADEIAKIEQSMNDMSLQLQEYIDREFKEKLVRTRLERETTQAKLLALQSQVNPHFLFNALETIRLNSLDHPPAETSRMIRNMSKMFRHLVDWNEDIICLGDDLKFLNEFLSIQKYRFGEEFQYTIDIESGAEECRLPKLILQPLVENACVHGVEAISNEKKMNIIVSLEEVQEKKWLVLTVRDNGGGVKPHRLEQLQQMLSGGEKVEKSVGLYNVYQRLLLNYGDQFDFQMESVLGQGTTCIVRVPAEFSFPLYEGNQEM